jgi:hypothetical protein
VKTVPSLSTRKAHEARWLAAADDKANDDSDEAVAATDGCY